MHLSLSNYFHTLKHLKLKQINYRIYYLLRSKIKPANIILFQQNTPKHQRQEVQFVTSINAYTSWIQANHFSFLNKEKDFGEKVDWNFADYGKLWCYNLNYFDFLNQKNIPVEKARTLLLDFVRNIKYSKDGLEPFPISLRAIKLGKIFIKRTHF